MNDTIACNLLSALLDKYERSSAFREGIAPTRRILLKLYDNGHSDFPAYDIERSDSRVLINQTVIELANREFIAFNWMKGEQNHIVSKVWLVYERLSAVYNFVGRDPKSDTIDDICLELLGTLDVVRSPWARDFLRDSYNVISQKRSLGNRLPEDNDERHNLLQAITYIDKFSENEILERVFSIRCFGDSKLFERTVKSRFVSILRKYLDAEDESTDEDLLRQVGIAKYPEQFEFCGNAAISFEDGGYINFSALTHGSCVSLPDLLSGELILYAGVTSVLTIENKANYIEYISKYKKACEFVVFHGGQYSPSKRKFFEAVATAAQGCTWHHWSDIDYGGFIMLGRLRREINSDIKPYRMDKQELQHYKNFAASITSNYAEKLERLLVKTELSDCRPCIKYMVEAKEKLEQEAMLTD